MNAILDFCRDLPERTYRPDEIWLVEGWRSGLLYILIDGKVEIRKGPFQIHVESEPGAVFGEVSALLDIPHTATVRTLTTTRAYVIGNADAFLKAHQELSYVIAKLLAKRLYGVTTYLVDLKAQFEDRKDHLGMVDSVLETLLHQQDQRFSPGSDRCPDPKI